jgi:hypothetical protein
MYILRIYFCRFTTTKNKYNVLFKSIAMKTATKKQSMPTMESINSVPSELWTNLEQLDFGLIGTRMQVKYNWTISRINGAIDAYLHFLYFTQLFKFSVNPTADIDEIWHQHILHTRKYNDDCDKVFGKYLHHLPFPSQLNEEKKSTSVFCCNKQDCCNDEPSRLPNDQKRTCFNDGKKNDLYESVPYEIAYLFFLSLGKA